MAQRQLGLKWRNIEWYLRDGERYLAVNVDGKTNKRTAIARDRVVDFLWRQAQLNPRIRAVDFECLISSKLDERGIHHTAECDSNRAQSQSCVQRITG